MSDRGIMLRASITLLIHSLVFGFAAKVNPTGEEVAGQKRQRLRGGTGSPRGESAQHARGRCCVCVCGMYLCAYVCLCACVCVLWGDPRSRAWSRIAAKGTCFFRGILSGARSTSSGKCPANVLGQTNRSPAPDQEHDFVPGHVSARIQFLSGDDLREALSEERRRRGVRVF